MDINSDLSEYHSDKDEIARLNKQVDMMADFYSGFYKNQIKELSKLVKQHREMRYKEKKRKDNALKERPSTVIALLRLRNKNIISLSMSQIAEAAFTNLSYAYKTKKELGL